MDLQSLRYFRMVAMEGSFSQAAQKLCYAQSNLSTRIRQLEQELGTPLFHRHAHGITLTEKGETLLSYADQLFSLLMEAETVLKDDGTAKGSLAIGSMESSAVTLLPKILAAYHRRYPSVTLSVMTGVSETSLRRVLDRTLDGAFVAGATKHAELNAVPVRKERLALFSTAAYGKDTPYQALLSQPLLVLPHGCSYRQILESWLSAEQIFPAQSVEFDSLGAIFASVSAGLGIALFPESMAEVYRSSRALQCHEVPPAYAHVMISFVWRKDRLMDSTLQSFIQAVSEGVCGRSRRD